MLGKTINTSPARLDAQDDRRMGSTRRGDDLPAELQRRESRLGRIREVKRALEARARDEATAAGQPVDEAEPPDTAQYNFTDPESRIMHHKADGRATTCKSPWRVRCS
jgi:hypothetical protein